MNIMKTDMLLLNNRIRKDDGDKTSTVAAPVPSTAQPQAGMKALMFQGMQNLMANPALAKEVGVKNEDSADENSAKSAPSNIAFQGKLSNAASSAKQGVAKAGRKFAQYIPAALIMFSTMLPAAMTLQSCEKDNIEIKTDIRIDLSALTALIGDMQTTLTQMLLQQQLSYEQFQEYMKQMQDWQNKLENRFASLEAILTDMSDNIIDIENGVQENNGLQKLIINLLTQNGMSLAQANLFLQNLIDEVRAGNLSQAQAMAKVLEQLKLVNTNLDTIISNQDRAYEQQQEVISILKDIKGDTKAVRAAAEYANMQLFAINKSIVEGNKQVVASINQLDGDMKAGIETIAQTVGWSTAQVIAYMNKLGIDIRNSNAWNASMIIAAINYNTYVTEQGNQTLEELKAEFEAGLLTAEEYANKMLDVLNDINSKVGVLVTDFNKYASDMKKAAQTAITELRVGNMTAMQTNGLLVNVLKNQQKAYAMLEVMNQNIEQIDVDMNAGIDALAAKLGCSTAQIVATLQFLGYTEAQISTMNTGAIINAIRTSSNKAICILGDKLNAILNKIGNGNNTLTQDEIDTIIALLESINNGVEENGDKLDELAQILKGISCKIDNYAKAILDAITKQNSIIESIKCDIKQLANKLNSLINQAKTAEETRQDILAEIQNLKTEIQNIQLNVGHSITPQELDEILTKHDKDNQKFYAALLNQFDINPADYSTIEALLRDIDAKMDYQAQANQTLIDILNAVKKLDKNDPDYTAKLNRIIELMEGFKFGCDCNCKQDCDDNDKVHEGVIDILS